MKTFAESVQLLFGDLLDRQQFFLDLADGLRIRFFHLFRQPKPLDDVKDGDAGHDNEEKRDADLLKVPKYRRHEAAKEISGPAQKKDPQKAAYRIKKQKAGQGHSSYPVKQAHRYPNTVNILGNDHCIGPELVDQAFDTRLSHLIKAVMLD